MSGDRHPLDRYDSAWWMPRLLYQYFPIAGNICEPCVGGWTIAEELSAIASPRQIVTNDLDLNVPAHCHGDATKRSTWDNLLAIAKVDRFDWVVTNFPFDNAYLMLLLALEYSRNVATILRLTFAEMTLERRAFLHHHPPQLLNMPRYCWRKAYNKREEKWRWQSDSAPALWFVWQEGVIPGAPITPLHVPDFFANPDADPRKLLRGDRAYSHQPSLF